MYLNIDEVSHVLFKQGNSNSSVVCKQASTTGIIFEFMFLRSVTLEIQVEKNDFPL